MSIMLINFILALIMNQDLSYRINNYVLEFPISQ